MHKRTQSPVTAAAYSVEGFCQAHSISRALFYDLLKRGNGPACMHVGNRRLIAEEAAREWRERMTERAASHPEAA